MSVDPIGSLAFALTGMKLVSQTARGGEVSLSVVRGAANSVHRLYRTARIHAGLLRERPSGERLRKRICCLNRRMLRIWYGQVENEGDWGRRRCMRCVIALKRSLLRQLWFCTRLNSRREWTDASVHSGVWEGDAYDNAIDSAEDARCV